MKTRFIFTRITAVLLAFILCVTFTDTTSIAKAKAKAKLSDTRLTMWTNDSSCISLERAASKVTWKSSNSKIVRIEKTSGKYSQDVSLETGNKTGSCTIKAKMKGKTYCCKITVKKGTIIKKYSGRKSKNVLERVVQTPNSLIVRYRMCAAIYDKKKDSPASYGESIRLEKYTDGKWNEVPMAVGVVFPCEACALFVIPPQTSVSRAVHLEDYYDISKLEKGSYRLNVNVFYPDCKNPYVKFKLK